MKTEPLRQLLYTSIGAAGTDIDRILHQSRHNNAVDGITGLLWFGDNRFLQVLEGPQSSVIATFQRIAADPRHRDVDLLVDRMVATREFGYWSMERRAADTGDEEYGQRMARRLANAPAEVRAAFAAATTA